MNAHHQWFWYLLSAACMTWYSTITIYVSIRGAFDIRSMLRRLSDLGAENESDKDVKR